MKIFTKDFNPVKWLKGWSTLSVQTRSRFIRNIDSSLKVRDDVFSPDQVDELFNAGFLLPNRAVLIKEIRPFRNLVRSMYRHRKLFTSDEGPSYEYVLDHLLTEECCDIAARRGRHYRSRITADVMEIINSSTWTQKFLESNSSAEWEKGAHYNEDQKMHPDAFFLLKIWIANAVEGENPVDLLTLLTQVRKLEFMAQEALRAGVRDMLLFVSLNPKTLDITVGILPDVKNELNREQLQEPKPCSPPEDDKIFEFPITYYDVKTLLEETRGEGIRVKADGQIFKKELNRIAGQLIAIPENIINFVVVDESRIINAQAWIECMELAAVPYKSKAKSSFLKITKSGKEWLAQSNGEQHKSLLALLRKNMENDGPRPWGLPYIDFLPFNPTQYTYNRKIVEKVVAQAFSSIGDGTWMKIQDFLEWNAEAVNPLISRIDDICEQPLPFWTESLKHKESNWKETLASFLFSRLALLGGARLGQISDEVPVFTITPIGRYLIGADDEFIYKVQKSSGGVIVQPNFEIIFTEINAIAESDIMRYAERAGKHVGVLFKITRDSILQALKNEMTADHIIESLTTYSAVKLPKNVITQIRDWCRSYRVISFETINVLNCPDAETAMRVHSLFPKNTELISDTVIKVDSEKRLSTLKSKLKNNGIGVVE